MILGGLQDFYDKNKRLPEKGGAFNEFLPFLYNQFNQPIKPNYFMNIYNVKYATKKDEACIKLEGQKKVKDRKYIETQFYTFKKKFTPKMATEVLKHP